jgi:hypothetical protein
MAATVGSNLERPVRTMPDSVPGNPCRPEQPLIGKGGWERLAARVTTCNAVLPIRLRVDPCGRRGSRSHWPSEPGSALHVKPYPPLHSDRYADSGALGHEQPGTGALTASPQPLTSRTCSPRVCRAQDRRRHRLRWVRSSRTTSGVSCSANAGIPRDRGCPSPSRQCRQGWAPHSGRRARRRHRRAGHRTGSASHTA